MTASEKPPYLVQIRHFDALEPLERDNRHLPRSITRLQLHALRAVPLQIPAALLMLDVGDLIAER